MNLLVLNAGSSSLRFQLFDAKLHVKFHGHVDGIGLSSCRLRGDVEKKVRAKNHTEALKIALGVLDTDQIHRVGHRVVHGGETFRAPTLITPKTLKKLTALNSLAPLHNPFNLEGIRACQKLLPKAINVAVFDTAFHATLPEAAFLYGLPHALYKKYGIRKYGFHGTSHAYVSEQAIARLKKEKLPSKNIITCHVGNGVSVTAVKNGKSVDTSMGFTPLEGAMMGTRTGDFDPAILLHLQKNHKKSPAQLDHILHHESGLLGLSGLSSDMRPLWAILQKPRHRHYPAARRAYDVYVHRLAKHITAMTAALNGLDALVFTAGIGENAWYLRRDVCARLTLLGIQLNPTLNQHTIEGKEGPIHRKNSPAVLVVKTNEELKIAKEVAKLMK